MQYNGTALIYITSENISIYVAAAQQSYYHFGISLHTISWSDNTSELNIFSEFDSASRLDSTCKELSPGKFSK